MPKGDTVLQVSQALLMRRIVRLSRSYAMQAASLRAGVVRYRLPEVRRSRYLPRIPGPTIPLSLCDVVAGERTIPGTAYSIVGRITDPWDGPGPEEEQRDARRSR